MGIRPPVIIDAGSRRAAGASVPSKAEQIRHALLTAILEHRLGPGTKLGEDEIGSLYGVSRTIVRGVLQSLVHEGIVVIEKNRGAFVAHPSVAEAREVFEVRQLIEAAVTARAVERRDAAAIARLRAHLEAERQAADEGERAAAIRLSGEFHIELARIAGHRLYETILTELVARSSLILLIYHRREPRCADDHHQRLVDAIEAGEAGEAVELMTHHLAEIFADLELSPTADGNRTLAEILGG